MVRTFATRTIALVAVFAGFAAAPAFADASGCPPDAPPQVIKTTPTAVPDTYVSLGRPSDEVILNVALDKYNRITNISVEGTTEPLLNDSAVVAARSSIFRTAVHDCKPVPATYRFVFAYSTP